MQPQGQPAAINMQPIMEALARRQMGGGGTPISQQASMPNRALPTGGSSVPLQGQPNPNASAAGMPVQVQQGAAGGQQTQNGAMQAGQTAQGPQFDSETRDLAKSLVQRLIKGI